MNASVHRLPCLRPIQCNEKYVEHYAVLFTAVYMLYGNIAELYGKRAAWQDNPTSNQGIPVTLEACFDFKARTYNFQNLLCLSY